MRLCLLACAVLLSIHAGRVVAAAPDADTGANTSADFWWTLAAGRYVARDYGGGPQATHDGTHVGGPQLQSSLNWVPPGQGYLLRLRGSAMFDFTSNLADELALSAGLPLDAGRKLWIAGGVSALSDVSNHRQSPTSGLPLELLWFPVRGLELSLNGNFNRDRNFFGLSVGWAIGRRAPG
jgi:hypothetical protein